MPWALALAALARELTGAVARHGLWVVPRLRLGVYTWLWLAGMTVLAAPFVITVMRGNIICILIGGVGFAELCFGALCRAPLERATLAALAAFPLLAGLLGLKVLCLSTSLFLLIFLFALVSLLADRCLSLACLDRAGSR